MSATRRLLALGPQSIRARMTLAFTLFIALLIALLGLAFFLYLENQEGKRVDVTLSQAVDELREEVEEFEEENHADRDISHLVTQESGDLRALNVALAIFDERGRVVSTSQSELTHWPLTETGQGVWRSREIKYERYTLVVALSWSQIKGRLGERIQALLFMGGIVVLLSSAGAWFLVGRTLSPLAGLTKQASAASAENLRVQLETPSSDEEMVGLVFTLNDLLNRISKTAQTQSRFYAAASHELRTPLHVLSLLHEEALSRPHNAEEYADALQQSHDQTQRIARLVQDLLLLNRLDMDTSQPEAVLLDLADICEGELNHLQAEIERKSLEIIAPFPPVCELTAPWTHTTMLLRNLIENAVKYTPDGGTVELNVTPQRLKVWNECALDENSNLEKYFEPFYRPDAARSSETGGNGLGLSICRALCQTNGWHLTLAVEKGGLCAIVIFH